MENWENGEYEFVLSASEIFAIKIKFSINTNGEILDVKTTLL